MIRGGADLERRHTLSWHDNIRLRHCPFGNSFTLHVQTAVLPVGTALGTASCGRCGATVQVRHQHYYDRTLGSTNSLHTPEACFDDADSGSAASLR